MIFHNLFGPYFWISRLCTIKIVNFSREVPHFSLLNLHKKYTTGNNCNSAVDVSVGWMMYRLALSKFLHIVQTVWLPKGRNPLSKFVCFLQTELFNLLALDSASVGLQSSSKKNYLFNSVETQRLNRFQLNKNKPYCHWSRYRDRSIR